MIIFYADNITIMDVLFIKRFHLPESKCLCSSVCHPMVQPYVLTM